MFQRTFSNSPFCNCGEVESTESNHFFHYSIYSKVRINTILTLPCSLNFELYLYVMDIVSKSENSNLFYLVQNFLVTSKMFRVHLLVFYSYYNRYIVYNIYMYSRAVPRIKLERLCSEIFLSSMLMSSNVIRLV